MTEVISLTQVATFFTTEARRTQSMGMTWDAAVRRNVACRWELDARHIVHASTPHGVTRNVVLFIPAVRLHGLLTA